MRKDMFDWNVKLEKTFIVDLKGHKYQILASKIWGSYRIDLLEDENPVYLENVNNESFKKLVTLDAKIEDQILEWGSQILATQTSKCDKCQKERLVRTLESWDRAKLEFKGLKAICKKCRDTIYSKIRFEIEKEIEKEKNEQLEELKKGHH